MSEMISAEEAQKLLDGTTPGPWSVPGQPDKVCAEGYTKNGGAKMVLSASSPSWMRLDEPSCNARLASAAPDLARTVISLHAQLATAKAAQAMVVERAAACCPQDNTEQHLILALADTDGEALVRELRERAEKAEADLRMVVSHATMGDTDGTGLSLNDICVKITALRNEIYIAAKADRDRLAAANAALEAKVALLVGALELYSCEDGCNDCPEHERDRVGCGWTARATLTEVQARDKGEGGE